MPATWPYLRQSLSEDRQQNSTAYQLDALETYYREQREPKRLPPWAEPTIDRDVRGKVPFAKRPGGASLLPKLGKGDVLLSYHTDRLYRNFWGAMRLVGDLVGQGTRILFPTLEIEFDSLTGKILAAIMAALAEEESRTISRRVKAGLKHVKGGGFKTGGHRPYGYRVVESDVINPKTKLPMLRLEPDAEEQSRWKTILGWVDDWGVRAAAERANAAGWPNAAGTPWTTSGLQGMIRRRK